ncbi:ABC transporter substrate-binding protein [Arthrobacter sp. VKM Ac-2550]|uniref:ABC transporter substrate-binding protein n=1 Tax=Crystallibacter permensis TaxID=1938888 RepID=UPI0022270D74|nr:ABC transporter substrate-binding protein [Arthrobacter sp. VKM Ac-2550]MCW2134316.1 NitT/TauT family transport system substrate-binding protein [Arthrobacter sp. VKM Ac-2550]
MATVGAVLTTAALALSACGGGASAGSGDEAAEELQLGYFPLVHTSTAVNADESGIFADNGLDVELVPTQGGAAAIPALVSGSVDLMYTNYTSALLAVEQGLPIRLVAGNDVGKADHGIFVAKDSGIETVADLKGKTFAVNNLQNIGTVAINSLLEDAGMQISDVKLVEMPYPDMQAALERGAVDAIWQVEPFQASATAAGLVKIGDLFTGPVADMPVGGWITTEKFAQENPEAIAAFQESISASAEELQGNRERLVELVPTFTKVTADVVEAIEMPRFQGELDTQQLQKTADLMFEYKIIDSELDIASLVAE